ncbi:uncharacterized protein SCHCODRAFT_02591731 [Schizophyllum commune H4-8]|nr:uncharacterized protein SCHCODRAFT_02591731 [Schizophyllum commune H4-8]KAI5886464.1 hypothetical protein SCHCODRAFT_02591731 [Schizophyllum commune H4-8]
MPRRSARSLGSVSCARGASNRFASPISERDFASEDGKSIPFHRRPIGLLIQVLFFGSCMAVCFTLLGHHVLSYTSDAPSSGTVRILSRDAALGGCILTLLLCPIHLFICDILSKKGASRNQLMVADALLVVIVEFPVLGAIAGPCGLALLQAASGQDSVLTVRMVSFMGAIGYGVYMIAIGFPVLCAFAILGPEVIWQTLPLVFDSVAGQ